MAEYDKEKLLEIDIKSKVRRRAFTFSKPMLTIASFGWLVLGLIILSLLIGWIRSWFVEDAHFFDLLVMFADAILSIFGTSLNTLDPRYPFAEIFKSIASAAIVTLGVSVVSTVLGFFLAVVLAIILVNKVPFFYFLAQLFVDFFRSTPLLVQILMVYFAMPPWVGQTLRAIDIDFLTLEVFAGTLALTLNTSAYQAEIIRSGILAIPVGQTEASRGLGLNKKQTMRYVILPQAIRIVVPPLTNEFINIILNSSLLSAIGVQEITKVSKTIQSYYFLWYVFIFAAFFYFPIAYALSKLTRQLERKLRIPGLGVAND